MKVENFNNRENDLYTFTLDKENNILWIGPFEYHRRADDENGNVCMVDPSGGPYIGVGTNMGYYFDSLKGLFVTGFEKIEGGYKILTK
jgi:hypothetical protein